LGAPGVSIPPAGKLALVGDVYVTELSGAANSP
jgi:hypothetical protein